MSTIFTGAIPTNEGNFSGVTGLDFVFDHTGEISGMWWYQPATGGPATVTLGLYSTISQALVASVVSSAPLTAGAWNFVPFAAAVTVIHGNVYTAAAFQNSRIAWFAGGLSNKYIDAPPLTGVANAGRVLAAGGLVFPTTFFGDAYAVDVEFVETEPCEPCPPCPPTEGFLINLTSPGFVNIVTGVGNCVVEALEQTPAGAPCRQCLLIPSAQIAWDNCGPCDGPDACSGQVALALLEVFGSDKFPSPAVGTTWTKCTPRYQVARCVVQVTRCLPAVNQDGSPPDCDAELLAAITLENDRTATRQAIACCLQSAFEARPQLLGNWAMGSATTLPESGGCGGIQVEFFVGVQVCTCPS